MSVQKLEGWKRRPDVRYEGVETSGAGFVDEPTPRWHLWGEHVEHDLWRIRAGLICIRCYQPFPERPSPGYRRLIMRECGPFMRPDHQVALMIDAGRCPYCSAEVSPEMANVFFEGYVKRVAEPLGTADTPDHGELEPLIGRAADGPGDMYLPPGWDR